MTLQLRPEQSPARQSWLVGSAVLTVLVLAVAGVATWLGFNRSPAAAQTTGTTQTWSQTISTLEVDVNSGGLRVSAGPDGEVSVRRDITYNDDQPKVTQEWSGSILHLNGTCPQDQHDCSVVFTVTVPKGTAVRSKLQAGDTVVDGLSGAANVRSESGDIELDGVTGTIDAQTTAGQVTGHGLGAQQARAHSESGTVDLAFTAAPDNVSATSRAGEVHVAVPRSGSGAEGYRVKADTLAGTRTVTVGEDSAGQHSITAHSDSGNVTVENG
jgi:hypothetical protein